MSTTAIKLTTDTYLANTTELSVRITPRARNAFGPGVRFALVKTDHGPLIVLRHADETVEGEIASKE